MRKLSEIFTDLKELLLTEFQTVRISAVQNSDQLLAELRAISPERLPGVVAIYESSAFSAENTIREIRICLVLIDRFLSDGEARALSSFAVCDRLLGILPPDGRTLNDVFYLPQECIPTGITADTVCFAQTLLVKQGTD